MSWEQQWTPEQWRSMLERLTERERRVMMLRFGLEDGRPLTQGEASKRLRVPEERLRQIEQRAWRKLKDFL